MTEAIELYPGGADLGNAIAAYVVPPAGTVPPAEEVRQRLEAVFAELGRRDQESNDAIAEYIRTCTDWSSYTRRGGSHNHYCIDSHIPHDDGSATYIMIDRKLPRTQQTRPYDPDAEDAAIRQQMLSELSRLTPGTPISEQEIAEFVVDTAATARVTHFSAEAVSCFREEAATGTSLLELLRGRYTLKPVIEYQMCANGVELPFTNPSPSWEGRILTEEVVHSTVMLQGHVGTESADEHIRHARKAARLDAVEARTHGDEYRELQIQYKHATSLTPEKRAEIEARMREIQSGNGAPEGTHVLYWPYTIGPYMNSLVEVANTESDEWGPHVIEALRRNLGETGLYLYEGWASTRALVANHIRQLQLAQLSAQPLER